jgi:hypothetical protein
MEIGLQKAVIVGNSIETIETKDGAKPAVVIRVTVGEEMGKITIWLTEKALGIARRHLKTCGFDPDAEDFGVLIDKPQRLAGKEVDVIVEQKGQYMNISLPLGNPAPSRAEVSRLGKALREVKKHDGDAPTTDAPASDAPASGGAAPAPSAELPPVPCDKHGNECALDCLDRTPF